MWTVAHSFFHGVLGSDTPLPAELADFLLMSRMGWSWRDLGEGPAPEYVRRFCLEFLSLQAEAEAEP